MAVGLVAAAAVIGLGRLLVVFALYGNGGQRQMAAVSLPFLILNGEGLQSCRFAFDVRRRTHHTGNPKLWNFLLVYLAHNLRAVCGTQMRNTSGLFKLATHLTIILIIDEPLDYVVDESDFKKYLFSVSAFFLQCTTFST